MRWLLTGRVARRRCGGGSTEFSGRNSPVMLGVGMSMVSDLLPDLGEPSSAWPPMPPKIRLAVGVEPAASTLPPPPPDARPMADSGRVRLVRRVRPADVEVLAAPAMVAVADLDDLTPRTLLLGEMPGRNGLHIWVDDDGLLHRAVYGIPGKLVERSTGDMLPVGSLVPDDAVLFAECADFGFCRLLKVAGVPLKFVPYGRPVEPGLMFFADTGF